MSVLERNLAGCHDDAQRVFLLREALKVAEAEHLWTCRRWLRISDDQKKAIARARKFLRNNKRPPLNVIADAYRALDWRQR